MKEVDPRMEDMHKGVVSHALWMRGLMEALGPSKIMVVGVVVVAASVVVLGRRSRGWNKIVW